ncbi:MAG: serine/threonine-protein kinase [Pseudomonadota bacterium]
MTNGPSSSIEKLAMEAVEEALDLPSSERRAAIEAREDLSEQARSLALQMLGSDGQAIRTGGAGSALPPDEGAPPDLPGYRIQHLLGRGGMGAVWLAERVARDFEHKVAIKVIKPGVLLDTMIERFRRERQILAQLNHPNIAILHDGGETADGFPFIVMEYVQGVTLRDWLAGAQPDLARKIALFRQIADAVEFAHQNLIIHRDLTPGNVLVTDADQAKLIDFGIASLQVEDGESAGGSRFSGFSLTPGYAAPERTQGLASNTLTDIFSLGRILNFMTGTAKQPELAAIAAKASAENPEDRYAGAGELIEDIDRFCNGEPVPAFSSARGYRWRKFVAREKALVGVVSAALVGLVLALSVTIFSYTQAERSRAVAQQRFDDLRELARYQLFDLYDELDNVVGNTAARAALAEQSQGYLEELAAGRSDDPQLQLETALGFLRLAQIQGIPSAPQLGEDEKAIANLGRADELLSALAADGIPGAFTGFGLSKALRARVLLHGKSKPKESAKVAAEARELLDRLSPDQRDWPWYLAQREVRLTMLEIADLALDRDALIDQSDLMLSDMAQWPIDRRDGFEAGLDRARIDYYRAIAEHNRGTMPGYASASLLFQSAEAKYAELERQYPNDPHVLYWRVWNAYVGYATAATMEDYRAADALLSQAIQSNDQLLTIEERDDSLIFLADNLLEAQAEFFSYQGRHAEALQAMNAMIARVSKRNEGNLDAGGASRDMAYSRAILGSIHRRAGNRAQACANFTDAAEEIEALRQADKLPGYIESLEAGLKANIAKCRSGAPTSAMRELS